MLGPHRFYEQRDQPGIDRVGLGLEPDGLGVVPHLGGVEHHHGQVRTGQRRDRQPLIAAGGLDADRPQPVQPTQPLDQFGNPGLVIADRKGIACRMHMHIQPGLAHIDPNGDLHLVPSLPKRARTAAPATVRDRWIDAERPLLPYGLRNPGGTRAAPHHRTISIRRYGTQVTRTHGNSCANLTSGVGSRSYWTNSTRGRSTSCTLGDPPWKRSSKRFLSIDSLLAMRSNRSSRRANRSSRRANRSSKVANR